MSGDQGANLLYTALALMLVASSLFGRRLALGTTVKMALGWVAIFGVIYVLFLFRGEGQAIWDRIVADVSGERGRPVGRAVEIRQAEDGHFWITGKINGRDARFLVDSGATVSTLSPATAEATGVTISSGPGVLVDTANGTVIMKRARAERLEIGGIVQSDVPLQVSNTAGDDTNVLGMSFLRRLKSWRVERETLTLEP